MRSKPKLKAFFCRYIFDKKLNLKRVLISDTTATTGHETLRLNLATRATDFGQYGLSLSAGGDDYNYAIDGAVKFKQPSGKLKAAYSLAFSYIDSFPTMPFANPFIKPYLYVSLANLGNTLILLIKIHL